VIVEVAGEAGKSSFQVLVNGMAYGHVHAGGQLPIHLQPYRAYEISVRPDDAAAVSFDTEAKKVTLYPGSVRVVRWTAHAFFTAFGQAVAPDGSPIADAMVQAPRSVGETDKSGYFQIDAANGDSVAFTRGSSRCEIRLEGAAARNDFVSLGKVICK
jgi:outer membrane usher protein FimD/PapC